MTYCTYEKASFQDEAKQRDHLPTAQPTHAQSPHEQHPIATSRVASQPHANPWCSVPSPQHMTPRDRVELNIAQSKAIDALFTPSKPHQSTQSQENRAVVRNQPHYAPTMHDQIFAALKGQSPGQKTASQSAALCKEPAPAAQSTQSQENRAVARNQPHYAPTMHDQIFAALKGQSPGQKPAPQSAPLCKAPVQTPISNSQTQPPSQSPAPSHSPTPASTPDCVDSASQANSPKGTRHAKPKRQKQSSNHAEPTRDITKMTAPREAQAESLRIQSSIHGKSILDGPKRTSFGLDTNRHTVQQAPTPIKSSRRHKPRQTTSQPTNTRDVIAFDNLDVGQSKKAESTVGNPQQLQNDKTHSHIKTDPQPSIEKAPSKSKTTNTSNKRTANRSRNTSHKQSSEPHLIPRTNADIKTAIASNSASQLVCAFPSLLNTHHNESIQTRSLYSSYIPHTNADDAKGFKQNMTKDLRQSREHIDLSPYRAQTQAIAYTPASIIKHDQYKDTMAAQRAQLDKSKDAGSNQILNMSIDMPDIDASRDACFSMSENKQSESQALIDSMQEGLMQSLALETHDWSSLPIGMCSSTIMSSIHHDQSNYKIHPNFEQLFEYDQEILDIYDKTKDGLELTALIKSMASALDSSMLNNEIALAAEHENYIRQNESLIEKAEQKEVITICKFDSELKKQQDTTNRKFNEEFKSVDNTYKKQVEELHQKATNEFRTIHEEIDIEKQKTQEMIDDEIKKGENEENACFNEISDDELFEKEDESAKEEGWKDKILGRVKSVWNSIKSFIQGCIDKLYDFVKQKLDDLAKYAREIDSDLLIYVGAFLSAYTDIIHFSTNLMVSLCFGIHDTIIEVIESDVDELIATGLHIAQTTVKAIMLIPDTVIAVIEAQSKEYETEAERKFDYAWPTVELAFTAAGVNPDEIKHFKEIAPDLLKNSDAISKNLGTALQETLDKWSGFDGIWNNFLPLIFHVMDELIHLWLPKSKISFPTSPTLASILKFVLEICGINVDFILKQMGIKDIDELNEMMPEGGLLEFLKESSASDFVQELPSFASNVIIALVKDFTKDTIEDLIEKAVEKMLFKLISSLTPVTGLIELAHMIVNLSMAIRKYTAQINSIFSAYTEILVQCAQGATDGVHSAIETVFVSSGALLIQLTLKAFKRDPSDYLDKKIKEFREKIKGVLTKDLRSSEKDTANSTDTSDATTNDSKPNEDSEKLSQEQQVEQTIILDAPNTDLPDNPFNPLLTNDQMIVATDNSYNIGNSNDVLTYTFTDDTSGISNYQMTSTDTNVIISSLDSSNHDNTLTINVKPEQMAMNSIKTTTQNIIPPQTNGVNLIANTEALNTNDFSYDHKTPKNARSIEYDHHPKEPKTVAELYAHNSLKQRQQNRLYELGLGTERNRFYETTNNAARRVAKISANLHNKHKAQKHRRNRLSKKINNSAKEGNEQLQFLQSFNYTPIEANYMSLETPEALWERKKASKKDSKKKNKKS